MSNNYLKAAFVLDVTADEAGMLRHVNEALTALDVPSSDRSEAEFVALGPDFAAMFPSDEEEPFAGFLNLFNDPDYPTFGCSIDVDPTGLDGKAEVYVGGDQIELEAIAELIFRCCKSALPFGFEYALDCDRLRPGEFGGGYVAVTADGIEYGGSTRLLDRALARATAVAEHGYVLVTRDTEHGLQFWNNEIGFDQLGKATVFTKAETSSFDKSLAHDASKWLALPASAN